MVENVEGRLSSLEQWRTTVAVSLGKQEVDRAYINEKFTLIEDDLKEIKNTARKLNYTVYAAVIAYIVQYVLSGGLQNSTSIFN